LGVCWAVTIEVAVEAENLQIREIVVVGVAVHMMYDHWADG
jgi:hypothetical protein